ncbi:single-stranded DNA-binding protein [Patescibacteria group bacterium]|nr:single-stranded DNA-binding protein [Patescibacteria group bacterium]
MSALNRVILIGNLTRDPELRYTPDGTPVVSFTLAVNRSFTNQQGEREADFIPVVAWRKQAERCSEYLAKGSQVAVEGRLQIRSYEDKDGIKRKVAEVIAWRVTFLQRLKRSFGEEVVEKNMENEINRVPLSGEEAEGEKEPNLEE